MNHQLNKQIEQDVWKNLLGNEKRKQFFSSFMIGYFENSKLKNSQYNEKLKIECHLIYINLLIECCDSAIPSSKEIYFLNKQQKCTLRQQMYLEQLKYKSLSKFNKNSMNCNNSDSNYFINALKFENSIKDLCEILSRCIQLKESLLKLLNSDQVKLSELNQISRAFLIERKMILKILKPIKFEEQFLNSSIFEYIQIALNEILFIQYSFGKAKNEVGKYMLKNSYDGGKQSNSKILVSTDKSNLGLIIRKDRQFSKLFKARQYQNMRLNSIIPEEICELHDRQILNTIEGFDNPLKLEDSHKNIILGIDSKGYAIPLKIDIRFQINYELEQFGIICSMQKVQGNNHYILVNSQSSQFICGSRKFVNTYLSKYGNCKTLKQIKLYNLIPSLLQIFKKQLNPKNPQDHKEKKILFFQPNDISYNQEISDSQSRFIFSQDQPNLSYIDKLHLHSLNSIYEMSIKIHPIFKNEYSIIEVIQIEKVLQEDIFKCILELKLEFQDDEAINQHAQHTEDNGLSQIKNMSQISKFILFQNYQKSKNLSSSLIFNSNIIVLVIRKIKNKHFFYASSFFLKGIKRCFNIGDLSGIGLFLNQQKIYLKFYFQQNKDLYPETQEKYSYLNNYKSFCQETINNEVLALKSCQRNIDSTRSELFLQQNSSRHDFLSRSQLQMNKDLSINIQSMTLQKNKDNQLSNTLNKFQKNDVDYHSVSGMHEVNFNQEDSEEEEQLQTKQTELRISKRTVKKTIKEMDIQNGAAPSQYMSTRGYQSRLSRINLEISQCNKRIVYSRFMATLSVVGMICILVLSLTYYFKANKLFEHQKEKLKHVSWPMSIRSISSTQLFYAQYIKYIDQDIFPGIKDKWQDFKQINTRRIIKENNDFDGIMKEIISSDKVQYPYFKNITEIPFTFVHMRDDKSYNRIAINQTESYFYFLLMYFKYIKRYSINIYDVLNEEAFDFDNFLHFNSVLTEFQSIIEEEARGNMVQIKDNYQEVSYAIVVISCGIILIFLSIRFYIKLNTSNYLKLITTFTPQTITDMINDLACAKANLDYFKNNYEFSGQTKLHQKRNKQFKSQKSQALNMIYQTNTTNQKKKMISVTTPLPILSIQFTGLQLLIFSVLVIPPLIVAQLISSQTVECSTNLKLMSNQLKNKKFIHVIEKCLQLTLSQLKFNYLKIGVLYDMRGHIASNMFLNIGLIYQRMNPNNGFYKQDQFDLELPFFIGFNTAKLNSLGSLISEEIDKKRYKQEYYEKFFYKVLKGNLCEAIDDYPQFKNQIEFNFDKTDCETMRNKILTRGFQLSATFFFNEIKPIFEILNNPNDMESRKIFLKWIEQFDLLEFDKYVDYLLNIITSLKNFIIYMSDDYMMFMGKVQMVILILYISLILAFCSFLIKKIHFYISKESILTKSIVTIISRDQILNNTYIMNQLQKK